MKLRNLLRIARWEVTKNAGGINRRTIVVAIVAMAILAVVAPIAAGSGPILDDGIYRVGVTEDSPYYDIVAADATFTVRPDAGQEALETGAIELLIRAGTVRHAPSPKGRAAHTELQSTISRYNDRRLRDETNRTAAFPVVVELRYEPQGGTGTIDRDTTDADRGASRTTTRENATTADSGTEGSSNDRGTDGEDSDARTNDRIAIGGDPSGRTGGGIGGLSLALADRDGVSGSPSAISPPFPFESLLLAFVFILPLNFLIEAYGSTIFSERLNRRGELLLVAPVSRLEIIGGKTLPYVLGTLAIEGAIAVAITYMTQGTLGGLLSVAAVTPLVALFFGAAFLGTMLSRSFKEMTFVTDSIAVPLTSYAVFPAIFTDVTPIALISPLTLIVRDIQGQAITPQEFLFSTTPPLLSAFVLFGLGAALYREEDMFTQRTIPLKLLDALAGPIHRPWHVAALVAVLLPFVFVLELLAIATLFALGGLSIPLVFVVVAVVEELTKSLPVYAAYAHGRFDRRLQTALGVGALAGVGFFLGEKITLLARLVGLPELQIGRAGLQIGILPGIATLLVPLAFHVLTAAVSGVGASRGRRQYALALGVAILGHLLYNYAVVMVFGI